MARYKKFIILENRRNCELDIRLGYPIYHADLIENTDKREGWHCIGGGFWDINFETKGIYCNGCSNKCEVIKVIQDGKVIDSWGNRCDVGSGLVKNSS